MKITIINNTTATQVVAADQTTVDPGETHVMLGRSVDEAIFQMNIADGNDVMVLVEIEGNDRAPIIAAMKAPADPAGGTFTLAAEGFDLETEAGAAANVAPQMYLGVFDDAELTIPSVDGTLDTAATGTIDDGAGTNLLKVTPAATGEVSVTLTATGAGVFYLKAWPVGTGYIVDASDVHVTTFTP